MLAALAREITLDEAELADGRWFTQDELRDYAPNPRDTGLISIPPKLAITRTHLDDYLGL